MGIDPVNRQPFRGRSCFPLSPKDPNSSAVDEEDQLKVITGILGKMEEDDKSFLTFNKQVSHLAKCETD